MSHEIWHDNRTGKDAMFCVGKDAEAAWHKLGQRTPDAVSWQQAMELAGLDWTVELIPIYFRSPVLDPNTGRGVVKQFPGRFAVVRSSDGEPLGDVGNIYRPIQNRDAFTWVDVLLEAEDGAHYESAGALGNGDRIWTLARVPGADIQIAGTDDKHETYLLFTSSHDGSMAATVKLTEVRVVCQNTLSMALGSSGSFFRIKHTVDAQNRFQRAKAAMQGVKADAKELEAKFNALAQREMTKDSMIQVLDRLFPKDKDAEVTTRRDNILSEVLRLFESNDGNAIPEVRGTAYNLLNAVTEYTDHYRGARITEGRKGMTVEQARAENALFGTGEKLKLDALTIIAEATKDNPLHVTRTITGPNGSSQLVQELVGELPAYSPAPAVSQGAPRAFPAVSDEDLAALPYKLA